MAASNKTQMVLSRNKRIIISNSQQPPVTSARQLSMKFRFIHLIIAYFCKKSRKSGVVLFTALVDS